MLQTINSGVYAITIGDRTYIGSSSNIHRRLNNHKNALLQGKHASKILQSVFNKHRYFKYTVLELCSVPILLDREQYWLDYIISIGVKVANTMLDVAVGLPSMLGKKHTMKTRYKQSKSALGKIMSKESNARLAISKSFGIAQYTTDNKFVKNWLNSRVAARSLGLATHGNINKVANGERYSAYGFKWRYILRQRSLKQHKYVRIVCTQS